MVIDLVHFNLIQRSQDHDRLLERLELGYCGHCRRVMLLEAHYHMADEGALAR